MWPMKRGRNQQLNKSTNQQILRLLTLVLAPAFAISCATFRSSPPAFDTPWPPIDSGPRPTIDLVVSGNANVDGWPRDLGPVLDLWGAASERAYRESALFSAVSVNGQQGEVRAEITLNATVRQNDFFAVLSYLTLLVLPYVQTTDISMVTRVTAGGGQPLSTIEVQGQSRTWYQLLLFPVAQVFEPQAVTPQIVYDMNRQTITELH